ncbi:GNAT family N-acetyltransferase [Desulfoferula mesophila]
MEACWAVQRMYDAFEPKGSVQGMPPVADYARNTWVEAIMGVSWNFVLRQGHRVVGHAAAIVDRRRGEAEYLVFILPAYQRQGLGSALTGLALDYLRQRGIKRVVLEVRNDNSGALNLYRKLSLRFPRTNDAPRYSAACCLELAA